MTWACLGLTGCQALQPASQRMGARLSFLRWNTRSMLGVQQQPIPSRALAVASRSQRELACMMETYPAPDLEQLHGTWKGINKGFGAAFAGITQDVKTFYFCGDGLHGHNISVHQVPLRQLPCLGWRYQCDPDTCQPKTLGKFVAVQTHCPSQCDGCDGTGERLTTRLDYTLADNAWYDPSRFLVDRLVMVDQDLLLGRAYAKIGGQEIPVAYFVLFRDHAN